jgi:hypothetical protein
LVECIVAPADAVQLAEQTPARLRGLIDDHDTAAVSSQKCRRYETSWTRADDANVDLHDSCSRPGPMRDAGSPDVTRIPSRTGVRQERTPVRPSMVTWHSKQ